MRLLCTVTGQFVNVNNHSKIEYAILSHTWAVDGSEQTYQDIKQLQEDLHLSVLEESCVDQVPFPSLESEGDTDRGPSLWDHPRLSSKIANACAVARHHGYRFLWIDSCCIDKTSSAELSEAINSMYPWYRDSAVCFAYLADVANDEDPSSDNPKFCASRWFTRGWTLQELIAPKAVVFLSADWQFFGTKSFLAKALERVTHIERAILTHSKRLDQVSVATRMSWASERRTTREEDRAYSLLGIFDITMPTLYGEGARAFLRLQEEILKRIPDQTIFAWGPIDLDPLPAHLRHDDPDPGISLTCQPAPPDTPFLALDPSYFRRIRSPALQPVPPDDFVRRITGANDPYPTYTFTPFGLLTQFPVVPIQDCLPRKVIDTKEACFAILSCEPSGMEGHLLALVCTLAGSQRRLETMDVEVVRPHSPHADAGCARAVRLVVLSPAHLRSMRPVHPKTIYATSEPRSFLPVDRGSRASPHVLSLTPWSATAINRSGYWHTFSSSPEGYHLVLLKTKSDVATAEIHFRPVPHATRVSICLLHPPGTKMSTTASVDGDPVPSGADDSLSSSTLDFSKAADSREFVLKNAGAAGGTLIVRVATLCLHEWHLDVCLREENRDA